MPPLNAPVVAPPLEETPALPPHMSCEQFLEWEHEGLAEWVNEAVIIHMSVKLEHQRLIEFLYFVLRGCVQIWKLGSVYPAPYVKRAIPNGPGWEQTCSFS